MPINDSNFWDRRKNDDYTFFDNNILDYFDRSGVGILIHKYTGTYPSSYDGSFSDSDFSSDTEFSSNTSSSTTSSSSSSSDLTNFEDSFFGENTNRIYDPVPYEIKCIYQLNDFEYDLQHFGLWLNNDEHYIEIHLNDCLRKLGRKVLAGDVVEMLHMRDDALLDPTAPAINKFYQVTQVARASDGWSATWYPHILRLKIIPMTNSQEFSGITTEDPSGILHGPDIDGTDVTDQNSDNENLDNMDDAILNEAATRVKFRFVQTEHFYVLDSKNTGLDYPWVYAGDGIPPNGAELAGKGTTLPSNPTEGMWFLLIRNDYADPILYQFMDNAWVPKEVDHRRKWEAASRILYSFLNNNKTTTVNGKTINQKQGLSKAMRPTATLGNDLVFDPDTDNP